MYISIQQDSPIKIGSESGTELFSSRNLTLWYIIQLNHHYAMHKYESQNKDGWMLDSLTFGGEMIRSWKICYT